MKNLILSSFMIIVFNSLADTKPVFNGEIKSVTSDDDIYIIAGSEGEALRFDYEDTLSVAIKYDEKNCQKICDYFQNEGESAVVLECRSSRSLKTVNISDDLSPILFVDGQSAIFSGYSVKDVTCISASK